MVEHDFYYTVENIRKIIVDMKYGAYNNASQKHIRTNVSALVEENLLEESGRVIAEYGRIRTSYHITEGGDLNGTS